MNAIQAFEDRHKKILDILFFLILVLGVCFRCYQYLMDRSLWEDEAHLALNFLTRDLAGILKPLDYIQAGPPLYLLTVEAFTQLFGNGSLALRALPFLASLLTLPLFYRILFTLTRSRIAALTGFLPFAVNIAVIYYSSEVKTYGMDVAVYILMVYLAVSYTKGNRNLYLAIGGCLSLLYSNVAFIVLFCIACTMAIGWIRNRKTDRGEIAVLAAWGLVFLTNYFLFIHDHPYEAIQRANYTFGFPPMPLFGEEFNRFMQTSIYDIGFNLLLYVSDLGGFAYVLLLIMVVALGHAIYRKKYVLLLVTCLPVLIHFVIALLHIYPFWYRLILYFVPALLILMAYGTFVIAGFIAKRTRLLPALLFIPVCLFFFTEQSFRQYPLYYREIKPALDHINKNYPASFVYITTPYTLYKYYHLTGYAGNGLYEGLDWNSGSMSPETYYRAVENSRGNYLLLHAENPGVDSFGRVIEDLKRRNLIVSQFTYMTYTVSEVKALANGSDLVLNYSHFPPEKSFDLNGKKVVPVWAYDVVSNPVHVPKGKYTLSVAAGGTGAAGVFPHLNIYVNDSLKGSFFVTPDYSPVDVPFEQMVDGNATFRIIMDNDTIDAAKNEDRNAFIHSIRLRRTD